jgi:hypothetical protein
MTRIILNGDALAKLAAAKQTVELCDETGRAIGRFTPTFLAPPPGTEPQISEEEIERRSKLGGGRPLREILADWEKRK